MLGLGSLALYQTTIKLPKYFYNFKVRTDRMSGAETLTEPVFSDNTVLTAFYPSIN